MNGVYFDINVKNYFTFSGKFATISGNIIDQSGVTL